MGIEIVDAHEPRPLAWLIDESDSLIGTPGGLVELGREVVVLPVDLGGVSAARTNPVGIGVAFAPVIGGVMAPAEEARKVLTAQRAPMSAWWALSSNSKADPALKPNPMRMRSSSKGIRKKKVSQQCLFCPKSKQFFPLLVV